MIILLILITSSHDNVGILLGENCCWSLLGLKGLGRAVCFRECPLGELPLYAHSYWHVGSYNPENELRLKFFQALFVTPKSKLENLACDTIQACLG